MSLRRLVLLAIGLGICAAGASFAGAPVARAAAGDDAHVVVIDESVPTGQVGVAAPPCGFAERAVGGGAGFIESQNNWLVSSGPTNQGGHRDAIDGDIPRGWYGAIYNATGSTNNYHFYAICSPSSDVTVQAEDIPLSAAQPGPVAAFNDGAAMCPSGQVAVGGGTSVITDPLAPPSSLDRVEQSGPLDETGQTANTMTGDPARYWYAAVRNFNTGSAQTYRVSALCSPTSTATLQVTEQYLHSTEPQLTVQCPAGERALSGGAVSPQSNQTFFENSGPADPDGPGVTFGGVSTGWYSLIYNFGATTGPDTIKFSAICEAPTPPAPPGPTPANVSAVSGQRAAALKKCKKKRSKKARRKCRRKALQLPI
jgi:hypothetical protein